MGIKLNIEITSPMTDRDHELLSGIAVMTLAIANHELAEQRFPEAFNQEDAEATPQAGFDPDLAETAESPAVPPQPCGFLVDDLICVGHVGHRGRHKLRPIPAVEVAAAVDAVLAN